MIQELKGKSLWDRRQEQGVLIAAHRGTCGGGVIQNTCLAYENALQHGADMIEIDLIRSTDGIFYAFHNGYEKQVMDTDRDIREMSSREIDDCVCKNLLELPVKQHIERLGDIMDTFRGRCLINIDRSWFWWRETIEYLKSFQMDAQIVLKSPVDRGLLQELQDSESAVMYMPILYSMEDWAVVKEYKVNMAAVELIFDKLDSPLVAPGLLEEFHSRKLLTWVNAITLSDDMILSALLDDNHAIRDGYDGTWGKLIDMGFDIIQTDWPALLKKYIQERA